MKSGYESLAWLSDKDGKEYVCSFDSSKDAVSYERLSDEEKATCSNVNQIVGTERW